jgi:HK97 family phage major capsid protein
MNNPFLASLHEKRNQKADLIDATLNRAAEEDRDITDVEAANVQALAKEIEKLDERIAQVTDIETRKAEAVQMARKVEGDKAETRSAGGWKVTREERTYHENGEHSFVRDAFAAQVLGDFDAQSRIARHQQEEKIEKRDVGTSAFAGLVVPQYLTDLAAPFARAGRPFADISRKHALPAQGMTISISKVTTGSAVDTQSEGSAVQETNMDDTKLDISVVTIAGQQNVSRQALERGTGIDALVMADLVSAYHTKLDASAVASMVSTTTQVVTYTDASPTVAELYPKLLDCVQRIQTNYFGGPNFILMHPRRLAWILAAVDSTGRPLAVPTPNGPNNAISVGSGSVVYGNSGYSIAGLPVITDANLTITNGVGENEDVIVVGNSQESHLWETSGGSPFMLRFEDVKSAELEVKMVVYGYSAYTANRYDKAFALVGGTGLVTPTF